MISLCLGRRVVRQSNPYLGIGDALVSISDDNKDDPLTLSDAMKDVDSRSNESRDVVHIFQSSLGTCGVS